MGEQTADYASASDNGYVVINAGLLAAWLTVWLLFWAPRPQPKPAPVRRRSDVRIIRPPYDWQRDEQ